MKTGLRVCWWDGSTIGHLIQKGPLFFVYDEAWLQRGLDLSPISLPFTDAEVPSESELRIAQAQLVGWLEGLFHGIQTALVAQQMAANAQLEHMRRALPAGPGVEGQRPAPGMYL